MAFDRTRTLRGALAGAVAAGVWAAQQPLDKRAFRVDYDDAHLLGRLATGADATLTVGLPLHLAGGALFGAVYANTAPSLPGPSWLRGPLAGLAEHLATWPGAASLDRLGRARGALPPLWGSGPAFAQSTWRHLLFGAVLGELERRLNPPVAEPEPIDHAVVATNGHGSIEHLVESDPAR